MARVSLGTVSSASSSGISIDRRIFKTTYGKLVLFAVTGTYIQYKTSSDGGASWDVSWSNAATCANGVFSGYIDTNNDIYLAYRNNSGNPEFIKGTYSSGSWSWGSPVEIYSGDTPFNLKITKRSNGDLWVANVKNTFDLIAGYYSTDGGGTWNRTTISYSYLDQCYIIPQGSNIWIIATTNGGKVIVYEYTSSWNAGTEVVSSGVINDNATCLGAVKISDTEIYFSVRTSSGIKLYKYNGSWDSGTLMTDNANDKSPAMASIFNRPVLLWNDYDGTYYNISYRKWNGSSWESQVNLTNDSDVDQYPTILENDEDDMFLDYTVGAGAPYTLYFDTVDVNITERKYLYSDIKIVDRYQKTLTSDINIKGTIQQTLLSDISIVELELVDASNKINTVKRVLSNITNDIRSTIRVFSDLFNYINTVILSLYNANNDMRTKKQLLYNINNDVRFILSWQKSASFGFQSLGKTYIKVYFDSVEQTDVDIDSISIYKQKNGICTASFDLGRAYDSTKPTQESFVEIKYHIWTLYSGYITSIRPSDTPDSMSIECQDEYWKQDRTNKYFFVGHEPTDNKEKYYSTIQSALLGEFSWNLDLGNFVPETIDCFAQGSSTIIANLLEQAGNYGFFYDIDLAKKLWIAGSGDIINITRQQIGTNLGLYQLISHSFNENISDLVNKYRVQMGDKVVRTLSSSGSSRTYSGYYYSSFETYAVPAWDSTYERLAKNHASGYGFDYHKAEDDYLYTEIYKKYELPYLNSELESWTDWKEPQVYLYGTKLFNAKSGLLESGYTIDYEKGLLIFNDRIFNYSEDSVGELISTRAPTVKLNLWKKKYYTYTNSPSDDPESDVSSPLQFFTSKIGTYPVTVLKDLTLSSLSIQVGLTYVDENGDTQVIPSWDDTEFAEDYALWQLSKTAYKKINGSIVLTLDALMYYNIKLNNRIYIEGITDEAMNIISMSYNLNDFTVTLDLENVHYYKRTVSIPSHGE